MPIWLNSLRLAMSIAGRALITNQLLRILSNSPMWLNSLRLTMSIAGRALITNQLLRVLCNSPMWLNWQSS
ncbi:hypothetical protein [Faecalicatena contorta]|uniref:hypothetical protein n=1 Tax=Faecalicatena contorta TaxID=39482 RepID=UPI0011B21DB9|nr:hypothetical protein [Faecalicatena contorta]